MAVARMAYSQGDYHAALRNLESARMRIEELQSAPIPIRMQEGETHRLIRLFGKTYLGLGLYKAAKDYFQQAIELANVDASVLQKERISDMRHLAECLRLNGEGNQAEEVYSKCVEELKTSKVADESSLAKAYLGLGQVCLDRKELDKADHFLALALGTFERIKGGKSFWYARTLMTIARMHYLAGRTEQSEQVLEEALNLLEPLVGPYHPLRARALNGLAALLKLEGKDLAADETFAHMQVIEHYLRQHDV